MAGRNGGSGGISQDGAALVKGKHGDQQPMTCARPSPLHRRFVTLSLLLLVLMATGCTRDESVSAVAPEAPIAPSQQQRDAFGMVLKTPEEIEALKAKALAGDEVAMSTAIDTFIYGVGVDIDEREAYRLAVRGNELGMLDAKAALGRSLMLDAEEGIPVDQERGKKLLEEALKSGSERALRALVHDMPPAEQRDALLAFDREHGIEGALTALRVLGACQQAAYAEGAALADLDSSFACMKTWLSRVATSDDAPLTGVVAFANYSVARAAAEKQRPGFGDVGALLEAGSDMSADSKLSGRAIAVMKVARAESALRGTYLPKNADIAMRYALSATLTDEKNVRSRAFIVLWTLHTPDTEDGYFADHKRAYGWALLAKSVFDTKDWASIGNEDVLKDLESTLSAPDRLAVQRAVAAWQQGSDLSLDVPVEGGSGASVDTTGTAFLVSDDGFAVTNAHVVKGCQAIKDQSGSVAAMVAMDESNDLAAIRFGSYNNTPYAELEASSRLPRVGDRIAVFGFPLSEVLASTGNLTAGELTANAGLGNNSSMFQISAPIQPGSSGSPVLSMRGNVAGIISSTASTVRLTQATGAIGQNLNFAINKDTVVGFLRSNGIPFEEAGDGYFSGGELDVAEIGARAREWTLQIECQR